MPKRFFAPLIFGLFLAASFPARAEKVERVIDGDTLILRGGQRVRLIGVDAPEVDHPRYQRFGEFYGNEAREYLRRTVENREVRLEKEGETFDKYGRRLAYVFLGDTLVNEELVRRGYAEVFRAFDFRHKDRFLELERSARAARLGLWNPPDVPGEPRRFEIEVLLPPAGVLAVILAFRFYRRFKK